MSFGSISSIILTLLLLIVGGRFVLKYLDREQAPKVADTATEQEIESRNKIAKEFPNLIVFDSNRSGTFGIYTMKADSSELKEIINSELHEFYPDPSNDGKKLVFTRADNLSRTGPFDIWIANSDGTEQKLLAKNGTFPTFGSDGKTVYFERDRTKLIAIDTNGANERQVFPIEGLRFRKKVIKPRISPDGKFAAFISDKKGRWNSWIANLEQGKLQHIDEGCEPAWYSNNRELVWIKSKGVKAGSGIFKFDANSSNRTELLDDDAPRGHEYFPTVSSDDRFLLYSAARSTEHNHLTSNYQVYIRDLKTNTKARITFDQFTNRWPKLLKTNHG